MPIECAWCKKPIAGEPEQVELVSHGICCSCFDDMVSLIPNREEAADAVDA
jgi:hypothetical protein